MPILPRNEKTPLGIYIHIPFCRSKCQYCDFYSTACPEKKLMHDYVRAVCAHIKETGPQAPGYRVDTVYFGGGTPSILPPDALATILTAVRHSFDVSPKAEITFEANPDSVTTRLLWRLKSEGFNRVSLGIQSDDDDMLEKLGRPHTYEDAVNAAKRIRRAGYKNLSVDLMYGLPDQTLEDWQRTLTNVLQLSPDHISCYGLKVEPGTPLHAKQNTINLPDDDAQADMYLMAVEILKARGFRHYEISNFAKKDKASAHNLKYWTGGEYIGFGPDASSDFAGKRFVMVRDLNAYIDGIFSGGQVIADLQEIPPRERAGEYLMMRLRTNIGISREEYEKQYLLPFGPLEDILKVCKQRNFAILSDGRWRLSPEGMLLSNSILSDLLLAQERTLSASKRR